jgi:hypothetical protein
MQRAKAQKEVQNEGAGPGPNEMESFMDMGKLNTARIRKATDPKIMEVKRRVRQVRGLTLLGVWVCELIGFMIEHGAAEDGTVGIISYSVKLVRGCRAGWQVACCRQELPLQ